MAAALLCGGFAQSGGLLAQSETESPLRVVAPSAALPPPPAVPLAGTEDAETPELSASWQTRPEARTLHLMIPAPRGQIVDRGGFSMAQNTVAFRIGVNFPHFENPTDSQILAYARQRLATANGIAGATWQLDPEAVLSHYEHRRWLPLLFSKSLTKTQRAAFVAASDRMDGLILHPSYERHYPQGKFAAHILGAIKKEVGIPTGPIADMDPLFEITIGRRGLEASFNEELTGKPGELDVLFDTDGTELSREILKRPTPGGNIITTLDIHYQRYAEEALTKHTRGGAMVVIDARNGDILAMASNPMFDPGEWAKGLSNSEWKALQDDPGKPLFAKAFQAEYPPASTFKPVVALAALEAGAVNRHTMFDCPPSMYIGNRIFRNWNKKPEGSMTVIGAIKRSCNTWFYTAGLRTGSDPILATARNLGLGQRTGLPIDAEGAGQIPDNEAHRARVGFAIRGGDLANISIGQGSVTTTPLQVARAMAALGTGEYLNQLRLVTQVQDINNTVIRSIPEPTKTRLQVSQENLDTIRRGMVAVVSGSNGTGSRAGISAAQVAGKTGTAQWLPAEDRNLAWFCGFVPAANPRYAFAAVYEGAPGEKVSGGSKAAPIVHDVLDRIYKRMAGEGGGQYEELTESAPKVEISDLPIAAPAAAIPAEPYPEALPPAPEPQKKKGLLRRLFGR